MREDRFFRAACQAELWLWAREVGSLLFRSVPVYWLPICRALAGSYSARSFTQIVRLGPDKRSVTRRRRLAESPLQILRRKVFFTQSPWPSTIAKARCWFANGPCRPRRIRVVGSRAMPIKIVKHPSAGTSQRINPAQSSGAAREFGPVSAQRQRCACAAPGRLGGDATPSSVARSSRS